jgi:hypothetical protein
MYLGCGAGMYSALLSVLEKKPNKQNVSILHSVRDKHVSYICQEQPKTLLEHVMESFSHHNSQYTLYNQATASTFAKTSFKLLTTSRSSNPNT